MTPQGAEQYVGGLSEPSKMPWFSYSIPAYACITGAKLAKVEGSVCNDCYAMKGNYRFPCTINALDRRLASLHDLPAWSEAMITLLHHKARFANEQRRFFRWHDSGDIQSVEHLRAIDYIAEECPEIMFWLPTREYALVQKYLDIYGRFASNLTVRLSAHMVDRKAPEIGGLPTSTVHTDMPIGLDVPTLPNICPARKQDHKCGECRNCWNKEIHNVSYPIH